MRFLCLAYGSEKDWRALPRAEQDALLAQDEILRQRGALMGAVESKVTTLRAWSGTPETAKEPFPQLNVPQAGFLIIEAENLDEVFYTHTYGEAIGNRSSTDG